jgi:hypothetical protein
MRDTLVLFGVVGALIGYLTWSSETKRTAPAPVAAAPRVASARATQPALEKMKETEPLPGIYRSSKKTSEPKKTLHGVPLEDYVLGVQNQLPKSIPQKAPAGVRVFVQCFEVKKGHAANLSEGECSGLVARGTSDTKSIFGSLGLK